MKPRSVIMKVLIVAGLAAFVYGLCHLVLLRFESGDVYQPYSSMRTDPLGVKAFYQSIEELPGMSVRRNFGPLGKLQGVGTLMVLGVGAGNDFSPPPEFGESDEQMLKLAQNGWRVVITLQGSSREAIHEGLGSLPEKLGFAVNRLGESTTKPPRDDEETDAPPPQSAEPAAIVKAVPIDRTGDLVTFRSGWCFDTTDPAWRKRYILSGQPVMIERSYGKGSFVLLADSYVASNEALVRERHSQLLASLIAGREVVFDETHLGSAAQAGVTTLMWRYNLGGVMIMLLIVTGLLVWKSMASFVPRDERLSRQLSGQAVTGRSSSAGLVNLLRRSIAIQNLLPTCVAEWRRAPKRKSSMNRPNVQRQVEDVLAQTRVQKKPNVVEAYRAICRILQEKKF